MEINISKRANSRAMQRHSHRSYVVIFVLVAINVMAFGEDATFKWQKDAYIKGDIKDTSGNLVNDVKCRLSWFTPSGVRGRVDDEIRTFSDSYEILRPSDKKLSLRFSKEGYYPTDIESAPDEDNDTTGTSVKNVSVYFHDVILRPEIRVSALGHTDALIGSIRGKGINYLTVVMPFPKASRITTGVCEFGMNEWVLRAPVAGPSLIAFTTSDPNVTQVWESGGGYRNGHYVSLKGCSACMAMVNGAPGDGVILFSPSRVYNRSGEFPTEMQAAPADGYTTAVVIAKERFSDGGNTYFYLKAGGLYGKCVIDNIGLDCENQTAFRVGVSLYLQPNGTRDVATEPKY